MASKPKRREADLAEVQQFLGHIADWSRDAFHRERISRLAGLAIHGSGVTIVRTLAVHGPLAVSKLARRLSLDLSTVSHQLRPLEEQGLVVREPDPSDRRSNKVSLTTEGYEVWNRVEDVSRGEVDVLLSDWRADDVSQLAALLRRFRLAMLTTPLDEAGRPVRPRAPRARGAGNGGNSGNGGNGGHGGNGKEA